MRLNIFSLFDIQGLQWLYSTAIILLYRSFIKQHQYEINLFSSKLREEVSKDSVEPNSHLKIIFSLTAYYSTFYNIKEKFSHKQNNYYSFEKKHKSLFPLYVYQGDIQYNTKEGNGNNYTPPLVTNLLLLFCKLTQKINYFNLSIN